MEKQLDLLFGLSFILEGYLSYSTRTAEVIEYRQTKPVEYTLPDSLTVNNYECFLGVPYGYKGLIGQEAFFYDMDSNIIRGPWLIIDVESDQHQGQMRARRLAADINCKKYISHYGVLMLYGRIR